ncbi:hypothetical protein OC846_004019 [Tilletia horrida]|uniref:C2H2-type domain-containing protein n=1 Tax=Tilletia horrida TaxID=155126 RepID=A0AAN6JXD7_9BASI|nr:hypothetical protein OC846_004019 [Tilletia horrida]KAK0567181.1 hypothetical protein OC861_002867 [Tilletia horrida]
MSLAQANPIPSSDSLSSAAVLHLAASAASVAPLPPPPTGPAASSSSTSSFLPATQQQQQQQQIPSSSSSSTAYLPQSLSTTSYLGIGAGVTPAAAADDDSFKLDLSSTPAVNIATTPASSILGPTGAADPLGANLDASFLTSVGTGPITFDFPSLPDGLLDEAPEYEYSAHTKANVFEAAQDYLADLDGARVFDLENFDPTLAGLGGDESLWSFADTLDLGGLAGTVTGAQQQQHSNPALGGLSNHLTDPAMLMGPPMTTSHLTDDRNQHLHMGGSRHEPDDSADVNSSGYAINYLQPGAFSGSAQTGASSYPTFFAPQPQLDFGAVTGPDDVGPPASKRRRGLSPRTTTPAYGEGSSDRYQQQQEQPRGTTEGGYPTSYVSYAQPEPKAAMIYPSAAPQSNMDSGGGLIGLPPASQAAAAAGNGTAGPGMLAHPYSRAPASAGPSQYPSHSATGAGGAGAGGTPGTASSRSRLTSWQGSPYPGVSAGGPPAGGAVGEWSHGANGSGFYDPNAPPLPAPGGISAYPSVMGGDHQHQQQQQQQQQQSFLAHHRLSEVSLASSSASGAATGTVPSGGGFSGASAAPPPTGLGIGALGYVPVVGVPVGPGTTIALGPTPGQQAEIIHSLGQALDASADADGVARCPYPNCNKTFAKNRTYNLKAHLRSHSQLKPFACASCPRAFSRKHDLERHARVHSGDKPYICEVCGRGFPRSDALRRHWRVEKECGIKAAEMEAQQNGGGGGGNSTAGNGSDSDGSPGPNHSQYMAGSAGGGQHGTESGQGYYQDQGMGGSMYDQQHGRNGGSGGGGGGPASWSRQPYYGQGPEDASAGVGDKRKR